MYIYIYEYILVARSRESLRAAAGKPRRKAQSSGPKHRKTKAESSVFWPKAQAGAFGRRPNSTWHAGKLYRYMI